MIYPDSVKVTIREQRLAFAQKLLVTLAAALLAAFLYTWLDRSAPPPPPVEVEVPAAVLRLSALVDAHIDHIFSPLEATVPPLPHQEMRVLREAFADGARGATPSYRPLYTTAFQLCDVLLKAMRERERSSLELVDSRAKPYSVALAKESARETEEKRRFFESHIHRRWADNSVRYRSEVAQLYSQLRAQERQFVGP